MKYGDCKEHQFRLVYESIRSIGRLTIEACNNCLSVTVIQRRGAGEEAPVKTAVEMKDSAYDYVGEVKRGPVGRKP